MENLFLQFENYKHELFVLPAATIRCIAKNKNGTRIFVEDYDFYDVLNTYESVLQILVDNSIAILFVPTQQEMK